MQHIAIECNRQDTDFETVATPESILRRFDGQKHAQVVFVVDTLRATTQVVVVATLRATTYDHTTAGVTTITLCSTTVSTVRLLYARWNEKMRSAL